MIMKTKYSIYVVLSLLSFTLPAQTIVNSLAALRTAVQDSNRTIVLQAGNYNIEVLASNQRFFPCSGSNNTIVLTGAKIREKEGKIHY